MRVRSLAAQMAALQQALALATVAAFAGAALWWTGHTLRLQQDAFLAETAARVAHAFNDELTEQSDPALAAAVVLHGAQGLGAPVRLVLRDASGHVLADSGAPPADGKAAPRATAQRARAARGVMVEASAPDALVRATLGTLGHALFLAALPILLASSLLGGWLTRRTLAPLSTMADRATHASTLDRPVRSLGAPTGRTEIDRMGAAFDRLLARLDDALRAERRLTADASHELRTPLTALAGELERVESRAPAEGDVAASIGRARTQVAAMSDLVESLLLVQASSGSAGQAGERFESVNLCDQARDAVSLALARHAGRSPDVVLDAPDEILVTGHPALVASAIQNLVDNALKFTRAGQPVRVRVAEDDRGAAVIVEDGGPGVPEEDQRRVFDPFFRSAEARAGTQGFGLGLPIVARVALAHRGSVTLSSSSALAGARFELWLPPFGNSR